MLYQCWPNHCCYIASVMSDSVWPHRRQPTRFPRPWDSPGKNTGVGCHFLLQCMKGKSESEVAQSSDSSRPHGLQPTRLLCPWDFLGKSTGVGCYCLLQSLLSVYLTEKYEKWIIFVCLFTCCLWGIWILCHIENKQVSSNNGGESCGSK